MESPSILYLNCQSINVMMIIYLFYVDIMKYLFLQYFLLIVCYLLLYKIFFYQKHKNLKIWQIE